MPEFFAEFKDNTKSIKNGEYQGIFGLSMKLHQLIRDSKTPRNAHVLHSLALFFTDSTKIHLVPVPQNIQTQFIFIHLTIQPCGFELYIY